MFYINKRYDDGKDFTWEKNTQYLINTIKKHEHSFIFIVDDIHKLSQNLLDAFPIKIKFDYMNKEQKQAALQNTFHITSDKLNETNGLVYGDFLRIKEKADFLNISDDNEIIEMLKKEAASKPSFLTYSAPILKFDINLINTNTDLVKLTSKLEKTS